MPQSFSCLIMPLLYKVLNLKADGEIHSLSWINDKNKTHPNSNTVI